MSDTEAESRCAWCGLPYTPDHDHSVTVTAPRPAGQDTGHRQTAAEVHRLVSGSNEGVSCSCGWFGRGADYEDHAQEAIAAALAAADRDGYQRGREEMAREVRALAEVWSQSSEYRRVSHLGDRLLALLDGPDTGRQS